VPGRGSSARSALDVLASTRRAGTLHPSEVEEDTVLFTYTEDAGTTDAVRDPYDAMGGVHPIFEMNLPEGALREKLRLLFAKTVPDFDDLSLLGIVGQSQLGRLRYAPRGAMPPEIPETDVRHMLAHEGARDLFDDIFETHARHSGVSGVQPKVLLRARQGACAPALDRITHRGATHIVKSFDPREYPELCENEFFCMEVARLAGLPSARVQLSANRRILLVDRFDLRPGAAYAGMEDFCVLSGMRAHGRYDGSYELVAKRIAEFVSPAQQRAALEQLFGMVALSCAVENGDAHLRNFAVLYDTPEDEVRLAPVYDVVCTTVYTPQDVLALALGDSKAFPDRKRLVDFGRRACGLGPRSCHVILRRVLEALGRVMSRVRRRASTDPRHARAGERLLDAFERGGRRLAG
jgi:serine/threonine-protein kinase HipA